MGVPQRPTPTDRSKFLLVDDSEDNLASLEEVLDRHDVELFMARSGEEALKLCDQHDFALAIVDVQMPGMDGFSLAAEMRGRERSAQVPIIFVTAMHDQKRALEGYQVGAVDVLFKPLDARVLSYKASTFIELARQRSEREQLLANEHQARLDAEDAIKLREEMLAVVSHDLRNPLSSIMITAKLLDKSEQLDVKKHAERILRVSQRMNRMIEDLLDLAYIEGGKLKLEKGCCDAAGLVRDCAEMMRPVAAQKQVTLSVAASFEPVQVTCDRERVAQVFSNLVGNSVKFTPDGGEIVIGASQHGDQVVFTISDTGPGIAAAHAPHVFDRFWQGHHPHSTGGVGLGLTIAKGIVEAHGGHIWLSSSEGEGASFSFSLPIARPESAGAPAP